MDADAIRPGRRQNNIVKVVDSAKKVALNVKMIALSNKKKPFEKILKNFVFMTVFSAVIFKISILLTEVGVR